MGKPEWPCFWTVPADTAIESFRRFVWTEKDKCPGRYGYHNASVVLGVVPWPAGPGRSASPSKELRADPRWPKKCDGCSYVFVDTDEWQHNYDQHWRRLDGDPGRWTLRESPIGAMWDASWYSDSWKGPDGLHLVVRLPNGVDWCVDGPSSDGKGVRKPNGWTRNGDPRANPPTVSASPSIWANQGEPNGWHGHLVKGKLVQC